MAFDAGLVAWVAEAMEPIGTVTHRAMMGGATLYCDGLVFAIIDDDALYFKSDKVSAPLWDEARCALFTFTGKDGATQTMNYRRAPDDVYDDADAMRHWAALALEASRRAPVKTKKPRG